MSSVLVGGARTRTRAREAVTVASFDPHAMIRIETLGGLSVRDAHGRPLSGAVAQPRRMAILAVLARAGERGMARDRLVAMLWPDAEEERARNNLAQALYALRRDMRDDDAIAGTKELRLDPDRVATDLAEFRSALKRGQDARAIELYAGPFLDGFHLPGATELERWIEEERRVLALDHARALESLARSTNASGNYGASVGWWRKLAATDPLNGRVAVALMEALAAAGDRAGALHHARIYEALLEQELDLPPDREVIELAERLRRGVDSSHEPTHAVSPATPRAPVIVKVAAASEHAVSPALEIESGQLPPPVVPSRTTAPLRRRDLAWTALAGAVMIGAVSIVATLRVQENTAPVASTTRTASFAAAHASPVVAVGHIAAHGLGARGALGAPLADLLATNLARVPGLRVISAGRMLELVGRAGETSDTSAGALTAAARAAGATQIVDGTLYGRPDGRLRLDLRRVELATGAIVDVRTVEGADLFALVDSGTARLAEHLGSSVPAGSVADVTTRSLGAFRLYVEGVRRYYALDVAAAERLLGAAVAEDSSFAMAAYYWALASSDFAAGSQRMARAVRLSATASDRERLRIRAGWALRYSVPELAALAESLVTRFPDEVDGHLYRGAALVMAQDYLAAVPHLQRAMRMDSLAIRRAATEGGAGAAACAGCDARSHLVFAYQAADSLDAAEREARSWTRFAPASPAAWLALAGVLDGRGHRLEARAALDAARRVDNPGNVAVQNGLAIHWILTGDHARVTELLRLRAESGSPSEQAEALWYLTIVERERGRLTDAVTTARRYRILQRATEPVPAHGAASSSALIEAVMLDAAGRHREAAALFDSVSRWRVPTLASSHVARSRAWGMTHAANALASTGDAGALLARADTIARYGAQSGYGRDQRLAHHVRGLALAARGDDATAIAEFRASIRSLSLGYTRTNAEMARALLRLDRPMEAVRALQPALRGGVDGTNLYVSRTEVHELLARAWDSVFGASPSPAARDSATAHYAIVARAWREGDAPFRARADSATSRIVVLSRP